MNMPEGATPKDRDAILDLFHLQTGDHLTPFGITMLKWRCLMQDGPSAGVTMTSALLLKLILMRFLFDSRLSMALDVPVKRDLAMTGEVLAIDPRH